MQSNNRIPIFMAALGFWLIMVVFGAFVWIPSETRLVALALLALTLTLATTNIFRYAGWVAAFVSIVVFGLVEINLNGTHSNAFYPVGYFAIGLLIAVELVFAFTREFEMMNSKLETSQKLVDELRLYDPITGLMRYQQALRLLKSEVIRSQRYQKNVCLFLVHIDGNGKLSGQADENSSENTNRRLVGALMGSVRAIDIPFGGSQYGAVLPETNLDGAKTVVDRLINTMVNKVRLPVSIGIAQFPEDGLTESDLAQAAEAALRAAVDTGKPYVQYGQIRSANKTN
jgi:diguanylate cyclase (GGDEF)-like protein